MNKKKKLIGYVTNNEFNEKIIPIPFQNILLRNYCKDNNIIYLLPYNEIIFKNSYSQLLTLINKLDLDTGIICCSIFMLPNNNDDLKKLLNSLKKKKSYIYSIYEDFYFEKNKDISEIIYKKQISKLNDQFFNNTEFKNYLSVLLKKF